MRRIEFTADVQYEQGGVKQGHTFRKGEVHDFEDETFANRWVRRGVAKFLDDQELFTPLPDSEAAKARRDADANAKAAAAAEEKAQAKAAAETAAAEEAKRKATADAAAAEEAAKVKAADEAAAADKKAAKSKGKK